MILVSFFIIGSAQSNGNLYALLSLLLFLSTLVFLIGKALVHEPTVSMKSKLNFSAVAIVVFVLCYFKYSYFQLAIDSFVENIMSLFTNETKSFETHIFFLGVSYFSFKFIHFLLDSYNKKIKDFDLLTFVNYTFFFPSFFGGPINRYNFFSQDIKNPSQHGFSDYVAGLKRIITGLFKKTVVASYLFPLSIAYIDISDPTVTPQQAILAVYAYMLYIYFDFSGYSDMAIGSGKLVGIDLPENFNHPFFKRNLQQFWANWHMSLTTWLTDYIYWPMARKIRHIKKLKRMPVTNSNICIVVTFIVCGLWHGDGINFFIWGTYHGFGLAILNIYTSLEKKYFPLKWRQTINKSRVGYVTSMFITFQYVAFGFLLFGCDMPKLKLFFSRFVQN